MAPLDTARDKDRQIRLPIVCVSFEESNDRPTETQSITIGESKGGERKRREGMKVGEKRAKSGSEG